MNPLVVAFCPTRNRRAWLPHAIANFQQQTYENRRMLIVADGEDVQDLIPKDDLRISLCILGEHERPKTNGEKFNLCCSLSRFYKSDILCKWDDDDHSAPNRIEDQVRRLQETGKAVTGYHTMLFTDGRSWWKYRGSPIFAMGTSLCFRLNWWEKHPFVAQQIGSDNAFVREAANANQLASVDAENIMVATIHQGNTSRRQTASHPWEAIPGFAGVPGYSFPVAA